MKVTTPTTTSSAMNTDAALTMLAARTTSDEFSCTGGEVVGVSLDDFEKC